MSKPKKLDPRGHPNTVLQPIGAEGSTFHRVRRERDLNMAIPGVRTAQFKVRA